MEKTFLLLYTYIKVETISVEDSITSTSWLLLYIRAQACYNVIMLVEVWCIDGIKG